MGWRIVADLPDIADLVGEFDELRAR